MTTMTDYGDMECSIAYGTNCSVSSVNGRRDAITALSDPSSLACINIVESYSNCNAVGDSSLPSTKISTHLMYANGCRQTSSL